MFSIMIIYIPEVNTDEIISIISSMTNSAAGYDEMPASIMKQLIAYFVHPLTFLINKSIFQRTFPDELKLATVLPTYKNDIEQLIQNYRPISVLPIFLTLYIIYYLEDKNLFYSNQFGFRIFYSTNHAIITLVEKVSKAVDTGTFVIIVLLDLKNI